MEGALCRQLKQESWSEVVGWKVTESWEHGNSQCKGPEAETCTQRALWLEPARGREWELRVQREGSGPDGAGP